MKAQYLDISDYEDLILISFFIENEKIMEIGGQMEDINESAYMNGYNWEAFLRHYLEVNEPELLDELDVDPEAGMYSACYPLNEKNRQKASRFADMIESLIESPSTIYDFVRNHGEEIEWD